MKHLTTASLVGCFGAVFLCASMASGQPTRSAVDATETVCYILDPGAQWMTGNGILHIRGQLRKDRVVPSAANPEPRVDAWAYLLADVDLDTATGNGTMHGSLLVDPVDTSLDGDFQGRFTGTITGGLAVGRAVAQGTGIFTGLKLSGTFAEFRSNDPGPCGPDAERPFPLQQTKVTGTIFDPNPR